MIMVGELDDWTHPLRCELAFPRAQKFKKHEIRLEIYPAATHDFDWPGMNEVIQGHYLKFNPKATAQAERDVHEFFKKHLKFD